MATQIWNQTLNLKFDSPCHLQKRTVQPSALVVSFHIQELKTKTNIEPQGVMPATNMAIVTTLS